MSTEEFPSGAELSAIKRYVGELTFPASREELAEKAGQNGAPQGVIDSLKSANRESFSDLEDVRSVLEGAPEDKP